MALQPKATNVPLVQLESAGAISRPVSSGGQNPATVPDRRRPGRLHIDNPHLIALLRRPASVEPTAEAEAADKLALFIEPNGEDDPLAVARGLTIGTVGGMLLWAAIGFCVRCLW